MSKSYYAVVIDGNPVTRARLREAASAVYLFEKVEQATQLTEGLKILTERAKVDLVLMSNQFGQEEIGEFIESAKKTRTGEDSAYVIVMKGSEANNVNVASSMFIGAHSLLFEPFSVDQLTEITKLADEIRATNTGARKRAALQLLIQNLMTEFDKITVYLARGLNIEKAIKKFQASCAVLRKFDQESFDLYFSLAMNCFEEAKPPSDAVAYNGVSKRLREKMENKLKQQYEQEFGSPSADTDTASRAH